MQKPGGGPAPPFRAAANLGPPPTDADEQESPVVEELRRLAFKGVADELEDPPDHEKQQGVEPEAVEEEACDEHRDGYDNCRNTERVARAVHGMLVAARVSRDPLLAGAVP
jgi:hypothetical protein